MLRTKMKLSALATDETKSTAAATRIRFPVRTRMETSSETERALDHRRLYRWADIRRRRLALELERDVLRCNPLHADSAGAVHRQTGERARLVKRIGRRSELDVFV